MGLNLGGDTGWSLAGIGSLVSFLPSLSSWEGNFLPYLVHSHTDALKNFFFFF